MNYTKLGNILKNARISAGMTQTDVAKKVDVTFQNISSWERGKSKIDIDTFSRLCSIYDLDFAKTLIIVNDEAETKKEETKFTDTEIRLISAYRRANSKTRALVDLALSEYAEEYPDTKSNAV